MRPPKKILLVASDEDHLGVLRFILETQRFRVTAAASAVEAAEILRTHFFEVLLCEWPLPGIEALLDQARAIDDQLRSLVLATSLKETPEGVYADAIATRGCSNAELLERVRILAARKRGPKFKKPVISAAPVTAAQDWRVA